MKFVAMINILVKKGFCRYNQNKVIVELEYMLYELHGNCLFTDRDFLRFYRLIFTDMTAKTS